MLCHHSLDDYLEQTGIMEDGKKLLFWAIGREPPTDTHAAASSQSLRDDRPACCCRRSRDQGGQP